MLSFCELYTYYSSITFLHVYSSVYISPSLTALDYLELKLGSNEFLNEVDSGSSWIFSSSYTLSGVLNGFVFLVGDMYTVSTFNRSFYFFNSCIAPFIKSLFYFQIAGLPTPSEEANFPMSSLICIKNLSFPFYFCCDFNCPVNLIVIVC